MQLNGPDWAELRLSLFCQPRTQGYREWEYATFKPRRPLQRALEVE